MDESRNFQDQLNGLILSIRDGDSAYLKSLIDFIREDTSQVEIAAAIQHNLQVLQSRERIQSSTQDVKSKSHFEDGFRHLHLHRTGAADGNDIYDDVDGDQMMDDGEPSTGAGKAIDGDDQAQQTEQFEQLLHRLKTCSNAEGVHILQNLFTLSDFSARQSWDGEDPTSPTITSSETRSIAGGMSPQLTRSMDERRGNWHHSLQVQTRPRSMWGPSEVAEPGGGSHSDHGLKFAAVGLTTSPISLTLPRVASERSFFAAGPVSSATPLDSPIQPSTVGSTTSSSAASQSVEVVVAQEGQNGRASLPIHLIMPLVVSDDTVMSRLYTDYVHAARHMLATGVPVKDVIGATDEVVVTLLFRQRQPGDKFDTCSWASELYRSFAEIDQYVRLANAMMLTYMMRVRSFGGLLLNPKLTLYSSGCSFRQRNII